MLKNYITVALRNIFRNRIYSILNILGLSLGLACGLIIFWFVRFQTTHDNFHPKINQIYQVTGVFTRDGENYSDATPPPLSKALATEMPEFKNTAAVGLADRLHIILDKNNKPIKKFKDEKTTGHFVHKEFFEIFAFPWKKGNVTEMNTPNTIALSEKLAFKYFGNEDPIGRIIKYDNQLNLRVVGIVKDFPENTDLRGEYFISFKTLEANKDFQYGGPNIEEWGGVRSNFFCFILLDKNTNLKSIQTRLDALKDKYHKGDDKKYRRYFIEPYKNMRYDTKYNPNMASIRGNAIWIMSGIGIFLIVTACFNFINMATAQALRRAKEVGIRKSIGGNQAQIFLQFMIETSIITLIAVIIGFVLASATLPHINSWLDIDNIWQTKINWNDGLMWLVIILAFVLVTFLAGTYPAMILAGFKPITALKGSISSRQVGGISLRRLLIVFQFVLMQFLVICTLVMSFQFNYLLNGNVGYSTKGLMYVNIPDNSKISTEDFRQRLLKISGVENASFCGFMPTDGWMNTTNHAFDSRKEDEKWYVSTKNADSHYINTFQLKLIAGKNIPQTDTTGGFLVNEKYLERLGIVDPNEIIGKNATIWGRKRKIYGVLKNWHTTSFKDDIQPIAIFADKNSYFRCAIKFNTKSIQNLTIQIEKMWNEYFPEFVFEKRFLDEMIAQQYTVEKTMLLLVQTFSFIAIFIGCLGLYGLIRFMATQKTKEIGVRKTYGASVSSILLLFVKEILKLTLVAFLIASPVAYYLMDSWLQAYPQHISVGFEIIALGLFLTTLIAIFTVMYESYKAAIMNPSLSLKTE